MSDSNKVLEAISLVMGDLAEAGVAKGREIIDGPMRGTTYRGIDDIYNALGPILANRKLLIIPQLQEHTRTEVKTSSGKSTYYHEVTVIYDFVSAEDGSILSVQGWKAEAINNQAFGIAIAQSYAYRTMCEKVFCIPLTDTPNPEETAQDIQPAEERPLTFGELSQAITAATTDGQVHELALKFIEMKCSAEQRREYAKWLVERREELAPGSVMVAKMREVFSERGWLAKGESDG